MDTTSERATVFGLTKIPEMKVKVKKKKKKISVGHVLGFDALDSDICSAVPSSSSACMYVCLLVLEYVLTVWKKS